MTGAMQKNPRRIGTVAVELLVAIVGKIGPHFHKCRHMIRWVGPVVTIAFGNKTYLLVLHIDNMVYSVGAVLFPHGI